MWRTVLLLIFTLLIVPVACYYLDEPLTGRQGDSLRTLVKVYLVSSVLCFVVSTMTKNYSQVDKLWSILPIIYAWIVALDSDFDPRIVLMTALITVWGLRLSYNFYRRGGYQWKFWEGDEDYRWAVLRARKEFSHPIVWTIFNLFFICLYQLGLILLFTLPVLKCLDGQPLTVIDIVLAILVLVFIAIETVADQQQWNYQTRKHELKAKGEALPPPFDMGFTHTGLWAKVRHPNYAAEQVIWILIYLFTIPATGHYLNWSVAGCLLLVVLFKGSSDFSEEISSQKYPKYKAYLAKTPRFIPYLFKRS